MTNLLKSDIFRGNAASSFFKSCKGIVVKKNGFTVYGEGIFVMGTRYLNQRHARK